jgi:hypothetical protein
VLVFPGGVQLLNYKIIGMKKEEFYVKLMDYVDIKVDINENTPVRSIPGYDSMTKLILIAFADENFSTLINDQQIAKIDTIKDYMELIGYENFQ